MLVKILGTTLVQASDILPFLGGILAAPVFFLALLHPFKRSSIAGFRWGILLMWVFAAFGMALFGLNREDPLHPNQIHILFAPIMAAYGLAFISILWSRLEIVNTAPFLRNAHYVVIIVLSAAPMLLTVPNKVKIGMYLSKNGIPHWPPYRPDLLHGKLPEIIKDRGNPGAKTEKIVVSDQPWAVAWYADTLSLWLPKTKRGFEKLEDTANSLGTPFAGFLISPSSAEAGTTGVVKNQFGEFNSLIFNGIVAEMTSPQSLSPYRADPKLANIYRRYSVATGLSGGDLVFYGQSTNAPEGK